MLTFAADVREQPKELLTNDGRKISRCVWELGCLQRGLQSINSLYFPSFVLASSRLPASHLNTAHNTSRA